MNFICMQVLSKQEVETDFNAEFLTRMIPRLEWSAVLEGAKAVRIRKPNCFFVSMIEIDENLISFYF